MKHFDPTIAALIDHTLLKPEATCDQITQLCAEAIQYGFASVCVNPFYVPHAADQLDGSAVKVCTVAGFPLGASTLPIKLAEADQAIDDGATEIDMVLAIGALCSGQQEIVEDDIRAIAEACHRRRAILKVILETALLTEDQITLACQLSKTARADFVKTSTGFASRGATVRDIEIMRAAVGPDLGIKASGGIRTLEDLKRMVAAGATRVGASASVKIIEATAA